MPCREVIFGLYMLQIEYTEAKTNLGPFAKHKINSNFENGKAPTIRRGLCSYRRKYTTLLD